jgi:putative oxidoreductase
VNAGLLFVRLVISALLFAHAMQKLRGWFHGPGLEGASSIFAVLGHHPARRMVLIAAGCELTGAILLALGFATPFAAAVVTGTMIVAGASLTALGRTFWNAGGGGEYPFELAAVAATVGFTGPGRYSLDHILSVPWNDSSEFAACLMGAAALLLAALVAVAPISRARRNLAREKAANSDPVSPTRLSRT